MQSLADDKQIGIKKAGKGSCVVVCDRDDYLLEAEKQLNDGKVYRSVNFNEKLIVNLTEYGKKRLKTLEEEGVTYLKNNYYIILLYFQVRKGI